MTGAVSGRVDIRSGTGRIATGPVPGVLLILAAWEAGGVC
jgi:hypothetical protein